KKEEEAADYLESVKEEADQLLKEIRNTKNVKFHEALEKRKEISALMHDEEEIDESNYSYQVGDVVELRNSNQVCEIIEIGKKEIRISLNGREMRVKPEQIRPSTRVIPKFKKQNTTTINVASASRFQSMSIECNLIGLRVEDALVKLEDYLAEAKIHGLTYCRIIHGDGTGRLRLAVHERLKKDKRIKSFMIAPPNEGGTGATIITFV
ncbi:MAG: Smr/MutS family protein, partial [Solobacterium sp.]|nr:Smr/MutS family protein [Solobacterium sp.]